jgi:IMP dehydrogenase
MLDRIVYRGLTFDDVLLEPGYSDFLPRDADTRTWISPTIELRIPLLSAPMDTVTESDLAIALAQEGGLGVIHKNMSAADQAREVYKVKRSESGIIVDPITLRPYDAVAKAREIMERHNISGVPITDEDGYLKGIITRRDLRFLESNDLRIEEVMTKENLVTAPEHTTLEEAERILMRNKVEKLLLVDENNRLKGLITIKDIDKMQRYPNACKDTRGRLRVGAAVGVYDFERVEALLEVDVDIVVVDAAHGHSANVLNTVREIKKCYGVEVIAGNVATYDGARALVDAGADAIKVGIGPGSICTTRVISGVGVPQLTAIAEAARAVRGTPVRIIADGGIRYSGDITKAIAAGAHAVMLGSLFAGAAESPGRVIIYKGRRFKTYRGMGSLGAMVSGSSDRYRQSGEAQQKLVPEGIEGRVPYKGPLAEIVYQLVGGLKAGMGYVGARTIEELRTKARFLEVTSAGVIESHPHDVVITQEAPNYTTAAEYVDGDSD